MSIFGTSREPLAAAIDPADEASKPVRESILDVTYELLKERGYAAVTTEEIASLARVSKATIYRHWHSKQELVVDATRAHLAEIDPPDLGSFKMEIQWILEHRLGDYRNPGTLRLVAGLVGAATTDPKLQAVFIEWVEQLSMGVRRVIQRGIARGDVDPDLDSLALEALATGVVARSVTAQQSFSAPVVESIARLLDRAAGN